MLHPPPPPLPIALFLAHSPSLPLSLGVYVYVCVLCTYDVFLPGTHLNISGLHADGRVGITEEELEEIVIAVQEDANKASLSETAARAVGVLTTGVSSTQ